MFLGDERVQSLALFIVAYEFGRLDGGAPGMHDDDMKLLRDFADSLSAEAGLMTSTNGWENMIRIIDPGPKSVRTFFVRFEQYLQTLGRSLETVEHWFPPGCGEDKQTPT